MIINNTLFTVDLLTVILELQSQLKANGIPLLGRVFESGDDIMVSCPFHKGGQEKRPSAGIRKSDGQFHCLACGETHSLPEVVSYCFGFNDPFGREGFKWLTKNFLALEVENRDDIEIDVARNHFTSKDTALDPSAGDKSVFITEEELDRYRYTHPYMYKRGLNDDIIDLFDIGYDRRSDSITFPVRDIDGRCRFVARRSVSGKRFDIPRGVEKPLYGTYELSQHVLYPRGSSRYPSILPAEVYVCEGLFDCLRLWTVGKFAVAGFGCLFNKLQLNQLEQLPTRKVILATDNDAAGRRAREVLRNSIKSKIITEVLIPEGKKDIGECTDEELQNLTEVF